MFLGAPQSSGDTVLWIAPPVLPPSLLPRAEVLRDGNLLQSYYQLHAVSSEGDSFSIPWQYDGGCLEGGGEPCISTRTATLSPHIISGEIPGGYPPDIKYFTVTITDRYRHHATWIIQRIPAMHEARRPNERPFYSNGTIAISFSAVRSSRSNPNLPGWSTVTLSLDIHRHSVLSKQHWALYERRIHGQTLAWEPYSLPWMPIPYDDSILSHFDNCWVLNDSSSLCGPFTTIASPYTRRTDFADFHGVLVESESRTDSVHFQNVKIDTIGATEAGLTEDAYCVEIAHGIKRISESGITFILPAQKKNKKIFPLMAINRLNLLWDISPVIPEHVNDTSAYLPDSPLCKEFHRPVSVWFDAEVDGKPLGACTGLPDQPNSPRKVMVQFPATFRLPDTIHDLTINVHQRVDLKRIPINLCAPIEPEK
jgi:hypothetical protein